MPTGLGDEQLWLSATNDNTGTSTAFQDQSGQGNNGTASGTLVVADTSEGGSYAFDFDGVNDYISTSFGPSSWVTTGVFSLSAWVKYDTVQDSGIVGGGVGTGDAGISNVYDTFASNRGHGAVYSRGTGGGGYAARSYANDLASVTTSQWYHVLSTGDGTDVKIYINGVLSGTTAIASFSAVGWTSSLEVGCTKSGSTRIWFLDGRTDDIRAYNRTLTQAEITHLATSRGIEGSPTFTGLGDEKLWFSASLNSGGGDLSGNGNDATLSAGVTTASPPSGSTDAAWFTSGTGHSLNMDDAGLELSNANNATGKVSLSFWVLPAATNNRRTFGSTQGTDTRLRAGRTSSGTVYSTWRSSGNSIASGTNGTTTTEMTHFVMLWEDNAFARSYVNGVLQGEDLTVGSFVIGQDLAAYEYPLDGIAGSGYIDDIRGYDRILTQAEITHLASQRGVEGPAPVGLGDEQLWLCPSLNDSANDISGNGNDGTYNGGMGTVADTSNGGSLAFDFDGTDDYIDCGNTLGGSVGGNDSAVTYSSWMKLDSYSNNNNGYGTAWMGRCDDVSDGGWIINSINGVIGYARFPFLSNGGPSLASSTAVSQVPLSTWKHVAVTYSGCETTGCTSIYIDGVAVSITESESSYGTMPVNAETFKIGATLTGMAFKRMMNGLLDDIRVFDRVLSQSEITHLATSRGIEGGPSTPTTVIASTSGKRGVGNQMGSAIDTTGADMIIMSLSGYNSVGTPSDSEGNTWVNLSISGGLRQQRLSYCLSPTTSSSHTFHTTNTGANSGSIVAFSGVGSYESENFSADVFGTTVQAGAATPTTDNSLVFIGAVNEGTGAGGGIFTAVDSGFTLETAVPWVSNVAMGNATAYLVQPLAASVDATLTCSVSAGKSASVAVFTTTGGATHYNAFLTHAFKQLFQTRLR